MELRLDLSKSFWENMGKYHERVKKIKEKIKKLEKLVEKPEEKKENVKLVKKRERDWYEKFRWMFTSNGFLCIGGKDAKTNELLVKKYLEQRDLFFHADVHGAPSVILKKGQEASEKDIYEAAVFAASYSNAWKRGLPFADVFYVLPEQVSLSPPSGEYRPKGGIMIYGRKNWVRKAPLGLYIGFDREKERFFVSAASQKGSILIKPGDTERKEAISKLLSIFKLPKKYSDDISQLLPPGTLFIDYSGNR